MAAAYVFAMRTDFGRMQVSATAFAMACVIMAMVAGPAQAGFQLGLQDPGFGAPAGSLSAQTADRALHLSNASVVRIEIRWSLVAPRGKTMPAGFEPSNPADPHYDWTAIDAAVRAAAGQHARIIFDILGAPLWAEGPNPPPFTSQNQIEPGAWDPDPGQFAQFARAAALRYSGNFPDPQDPGLTLPKVTYWEIWNEENLPLYLAGPDIVGEYRGLLDAGYSAVKSVNSSNVVVIGGLAPVSYVPPYSIAPLQFAAELLCVHRVATGYRADQSCPQPAEFDVFAMHPYSLGATPTKHAYQYSNVLVGDMGKVAALVAAADRLHTVAPSIKHQLWVTEFAWPTNPPDKLVGDRGRVAARYVAYSLYEMWRAGVSLVVWQTVLDTPTASLLGGGLYAEDGAPKATLRAFAFPFVASVNRGSGFAWGRVPRSRRVKVVVERRSGSGWQKVARTRTSADGIFSVRFSARGNGVYRALTAYGQASLPYNSQPIPPKRTHDFNPST